MNSFQKKYYVVTFSEDSRDEYDNPPQHVCISEYEDDPTDAICWMSDDLETEKAELIAQIICNALNKSDISEILG